MVGTIPPELEGCYLRNGVNQRYEPQGKMHMFDGDAMLQAFMFSGGKCTSYANSWVRTPRFLANEVAGKDLYCPFGDLTIAGLPVAKKWGLQALKMRAGLIPYLPPTRAQNASTATQLIGGALYACVEVNSPFRVWVDPQTGVVTSGTHNDFGGEIPVFTAHSRTDPSGNVVYFAKGARSEDAQKQNPNRYGEIGPDGALKTCVEFKAGEGAPLHCLVMQLVFL